MHKEVLSDEHPGACLCGSLLWDVGKPALKKEKNKFNAGYVIVMSIYGEQELTGPLYKEDPSAWKK